VDPVSPYQFAHIALRTPRYKEMCHFYLTMLNAKPAFSKRYEKTWLCLGRGAYSIQSCALTWCKPLQRMPETPEQKARRAAAQRLGFDRAR
jgi:hypothetical protein